MGDYWLKFYIEVIDDPKMAVLPDNLWRRFFELCALSAKLYTDKSGSLPPANQIAWALRMPLDDVEAELVELEKTGMIARIDNGWLIVNFSKRQGPATTKERVEKHRNKLHSDQYNGNATSNNAVCNDGVTDVKRFCNESLHRAEAEAEAETESETEAEAESNNGKIFRIYEEGFGPITSVIGDELLSLKSDYPAGWLEDALKEAELSNVRKLSYVRAILERWRRDGRNGKRAPSAPHAPPKREFILSNGEKVLL